MEVLLALFLVWLLLMAFAWAGAMLLIGLVLGLVMLAAWALAHAVSWIARRL